MEVEGRDAVGRARKKRMGKSWREVGLPVACLTLGALHETSTRCFVLEGVRASTALPGVWPGGEGNP